MPTVEVLTKNREDSEALVKTLVMYSRIVADGKYTEAVSLLHSLVPSGHDKGPKIPVTTEILSMLPPRKALAIKIAHSFCAEFNRNFGVHTQAGRLLEWNNPDLQRFFRSMGTFLHLALSDGDNAIIHVETVITTHQALLRLEQWAEQQL